MSYDKLCVQINFKCSEKQEQLLKIKKQINYMVPLTTITSNKLVTNKKTVKTIKHYVWYKKLKQNHF